MADITTIGLDLTKNVFQIHGIDATGQEFIRRQLRRFEVLKVFATLPPTLVGMEACATTHPWAREITKLGIVYRRSRLSRINVNWNTCWNSFLARAFFPRRKQLMGRSNATLLHRNRQTARLAAGGVASMTWMGLMEYALLKLF